MNTATAEAYGVASAAPVPEPPPASSTLTPAPWAAPGEAACLPMEVDGALVAGRALLTAAGAADEWSGRVRRDVLSAIEALSGVLAAARSRVLSAEQAAGTWALSGDRDFAAWVGRTSRQGPGAGVAAVRLAGTLAAAPRVAEALAHGPVTAAHAQTLARATGGSPALAEHVRSASGQDEVVALAGRLDAAGFAKALARRSAELDPASRQRSHDQQVAARYLNVSHTAAGTFLKGQLDSVSGHKFTLALEALTPRPGADDDRDPAQRRADALALMAEQVLDAPDEAPGNPARPHVSLVLREETWHALRGTRQPSGHANSVRSTGSSPSGSAAVPGSAAALVPALVGVPPVCDEDGTPWPASEVARVLCDCSITRVVVDARDVPVNLGRTQRLFSASQRRAVAVRDGGGCAYPDCSTPNRHVELHHIRWWERDIGDTDLELAFPACSYHHHVIHQRDIAITRTPAGEYLLTYPDGRRVRAPGPGVTDRPPQGFRGEEPPEAVDPCPPSELLLWAG